MDGKSWLVAQTPKIPLSIKEKLLLIAISVVSLLALASVTDLTGFITVHTQEKVLR